MAGECDKPKKDDPPSKGAPKGDQSKDGAKGKTAKGHPADAGKRKPQINKVETEATSEEKRELQKQDSSATEPEHEPGKQLEDFQRTIVKMLKEKERISNPFEELGLIVDTIKKTMEVKAKTIKIRKINKSKKRCGLLNSGATNNVRGKKE